MLVVNRMPNQERAPTFWDILHKYRCETMPAGLPKRPVIV
jgi:hypothetical protein